LNTTRQEIIPTVTVHLLEMGFQHSALPDSGELLNAAAARASGSTDDAGVAHVACSEASVSRAARDSYALLGQQRRSRRDRMPASAELARPEIFPVRLPPQTMVFPDHPYTRRTCRIVARARRAVRVDTKSDAVRLRD
jgi:hypothetical protein